MSEGAHPRLENEGRATCTSQLFPLVLKRSEKVFSARKLEKMNRNESEQNRLLAEYIEEYKTRLDVTPAIRSLLYSLVCCEVEERQLQHFVNEHGTTYNAPSGFSKQRPEWQQLSDNRQRKTAIVSKLETFVGTHEPSDEGDLIAQLRARLD